MEYNNTVIYNSKEKKPNSKFILYLEVFWKNDQTMLISSLINQFIFDATFNNSKDLSQLLIIIFKDIMIIEYYPSFYI